MSSWNSYYSLLSCIHCGLDLTIVRPSTDLAQYDGVNGELKCSSCGRSYPLFDDIPIMFKDGDRTRLLIDPVVREQHRRAAEVKMQQAAPLTGDELRDLRECEQPEVDALGWEILFWERWKGPEKIWHILNEETIAAFLSTDEEGGGRKRFADRVMSMAKSGGGRRLLNIGAGKDFLLETFLANHWEVIEQDVVLESLIMLKQRKACFCVCCDARLLPFRDGLFSTATAFGVLHHVWPIEEPVYELLRVTSGDIHINEPNGLALTRVARAMPGPLRRKLKKCCSGDYSHSPYERSIDPREFKLAVRSCGGEVTCFAYPKSSWIQRGAKGVRRLLRAIDTTAIRIYPPFSSHFYAVIRKRQ